ncbi:hypothetical protein BSKO_12833 [Bryopsis sp. KO-2023]|nr:hypothetical protein BSKO_12833 [Bryopsis sp. KO-2023]
MGSTLFDSENSQVGLIASDPTTDAQAGVSLSKPPVLRPCQHQVAGHLFEAGKAGSLVDDRGNFYKPLQPGPRGARELAFYEHVFCHASSSGSQKTRRTAVESEEEEGIDTRWNRKDIHLKFVPRFSGTIDIGGRKLLALEDVGARYSKPSVIDIKIGYRTWYNSSDERYVARARAKDEATTQASLGFKICGWQVYKHSKEKICRGSKSFCKTMSEGQVDRAFCDFADNETGLGPESVFGGTFGAIPQLLELHSWFQHQRMFHFYSSSVLIFYEGSAACPEDLNVRVSMVDFAHTFPAEGRWDENYLEGLTSLIDHLGLVAGDRCSNRACTDSPIGEVPPAPSSRKFSKNQDLLMVCGSFSSQP